MSELLIGAHCSISGGLDNAIQEGVSIGATTIQIFTANQRRWEGKTLTPEAVHQWTQTLAKSPISHVMSHGSYLINLGAPDPTILQKSRKAFEQEIQRCLALGLCYLNFHPGAALKDDRQACMDRIVESLTGIHPMVQGTTLKLLIETTAGQGSTLGWQFEEIGYIIDGLDKAFPIGVCLDTCHSFAAGYDLRDRRGWEETLMAFDEAIGLSYLSAFHLNDSKHELGSRKDRHANLGEGHIGWKGFEFLMRDPRTQVLPKYLETPGGPKMWKKEIAQLRQLATK